MRLLLLAAVLYVAAVLQTSLVEVICIGRVEPDLPALVAMIWLLLATGPRSFLVAGCIGLASDLISPGPLGVAAACYLLVGYAVVRLRRHLAPDRFLGQLLTVWVGVSLTSVGQVLGLWILGEVPQSLGLSLVRALGVGLYSAGIGLPVLMVVGWIREPHLARRREFRDY